jgi:hypothetical protein
MAVTAATSLEVDHELEPKHMVLIVSSFPEVSLELKNMVVTALAFLGVDHDATHMVLTVSTFPEESHAYRRALRHSGTGVVPFPIPQNHDGQNHGGWKLNH